MLDFNSLREDVYDTIAPLLPTQQFIYNYQADVKPTDNSGVVVDSYVTFRFTDIQEIGMQKNGEVDVNGFQQIRHLFSITLVLQTIGKNSYENAVNLYTKMLRQSVHESFKSFGLHFYDRGVIRDTPKPTQTGWEDRNRFDFRFYVVVEDQDYTSWIEFIEITTQITNPQDVTVIETVNTIDIIP